MNTNGGEVAVIGSNPFKSLKFGETSWKSAIYQIVTSTDINFPQIRTFKNFHRKFCKPGIIRQVEVSQIIKW